MRARRFAGARSRGVRPSVDRQLEQRRDPVVFGGGADLDLDEEEDLQIQQWLDRPPRLDDLDPMSIPPAHRLIFVREIEGLIEADGEVSDEERDSLEIFKQLLAD